MKPRTLAVMLASLTVLALSASAAPQAGVTLGGDTTNKAVGVNAATVGGDLLRAPGANSAVVAGFNGTSLGARSLVLGGSGDRALGHGALAGGARSVASGAYTMAFGIDAKALHPASFVWSSAGPGVFPSAGANTFNVRAAGGARTIVGDGGLLVLPASPAPNLVGGGSSNGMGLNTAMSSIAGGRENVICPSGNESSCWGNFIGGGADHGLCGDFGGCDWNSIGGGKNNVLCSQNPGCDTNTIAGGGRNEICSSPHDAPGSCDHNTIGGGWENKICSDPTQASACERNVIAGGDANRICPTGTGCLYDAIGGGEGNVVLADHGTVPGGKDAAARSPGQLAHASGRFMQIGDAQRGVYVVRGFVPNGGVTDLALDDLASRPVVPPGAVWRIEMNAVAANSIETESFIGWARVALTGAGMTVVASAIEVDDGANGLGTPTWVVDDGSDTVTMSIASGGAGDEYWLATFDVVELVPPAIE